MSRTFTAALIAVVMLSAVPALAEIETVTQAVSYRDLDLSRSAGVKVLDHRVEMAIRNVCGQPDMRDFEMMALARRCRATAIANTATQIAAVTDAAQRMTNRSTGTRIGSR